MNEFVLDSSAVLAYLHKETGWQIVEQILQTADCLISTVNYSEIVGKLVEKGLPIDAIRNALDALNLKLIDLKDIMAFPTRLESTTMILAYGFDTFFMRVSPENNFDLLQEGFNYSLLFLFTAGLAITLYMVKRYQRNSAQSQKFLTQ